MCVHSFLCIQSNKLFGLEAGYLKSTELKYNMRIFFFKSRLPDIKLKFEFNISPSN